jgi:hypothetical protein
VQFRNVAVHSILTDDDPVEPVASCDEVTKQVKAAMPTMASPTTLGAAALEAGKHEEMESEELRKFLKQYELEHLKSTARIRWGAKKL